MTTIRDMDRRIVRLPARPTDPVRIAPGTDMSHRPGHSHRLTIDAMLRADRRRDKPGSLGQVLAVFAAALALLFVLGLMG